MSQNKPQKIDLAKYDLNFEKILHWASSFSNLVYLNSNNYNLVRKDQKKGYKKIIAFGKKQHFSSILSFSNRLKYKEIWTFGLISYDFKNRIEKLPNPKKNDLNFPLFYFFEPEFLIYETEKGIFYEGEQNIDDILSVVKLSSKKRAKSTKIELKSDLSKQAYIKSVQTLQKHIQAGDIYEVTFCQRFYAKHEVSDPIELFLDLNALSPNPFSGFVKLNDHYLMCASPERFLKKEGSRLISQPIKGTAPRFSDQKKDLMSKQGLQHSIKERAENVMIVDLVRNDLSKIARMNSVQVDELFGIYEFPHVFQMISTISCQVRKNTSFKDIIHATFPMGSMTGAPKVRAMELIDKYEKTSRNLFSGTIGYIDSSGDFDFNVVIRSLFYNATLKHLSFSVGSAITAKSNPEQEYEECLWKAKAILKILKGK